MNAQAPNAELGIEISPTLQGISNRLCALGADICSVDQHSNQGEGLLT